jgi:ABC-type dipeptide/oligopeptide/nickel transport system permease component
MIRHLFRRLLWIFPSVLAVSFIGFFILSRMPAPAGGADDDASERRRRIDELPLFFNVQPRDVRSRVAEIVDVLVGADPDGEAAERAEAMLARLGGAALPVLLPQLDALAPEDRARVALALEPVGERMGLDHRGELDEPAEVVRFWTRFWESRSAEFHEGTARSAVRRYARYGTEQRAQPLRVLDTFALPFLIEALDPESPEATARLTAVLADVTGRSDRVSAGASPLEVEAVVERWQRWWLAFQADYRELTGADRVAAVALETRYGKWALEWVVMGLGRDPDGRPVRQLITARARVTSTLLSLGLVLAYLLAVPLGAVGAAMRRRPVDRWMAFVTMGPYLATPAVLGVVLFGVPLDAPLVVGAVLLALVLMADPARHQRAALLVELTQPYVRAAVARGAGAWRAVVGHGLRNALLPLCTRAALELPIALTACFVLERALRLDGLGPATVEAVRQRDTGWLMALALGGAVASVLALTLSDLAHALVDPRLRQTWLQPRRGKA